MEGGSNRDWWPNQLNLKILQKNPDVINPLDKGFDYSSAVQTLDVDAVRADIVEVMRTSQEWWPADFGHYGPLFIRMSWHAAGTYRVKDGRGGGGAGMQRFAPLNSWPDNASLDKARRLLWPVKKKYGKSLSWADLIVYAGNVALEDMGFRTAGFAFGREDRWEPEEDVYWGPELEWLDDKRYTGKRDLENPLAAVQMGLIYVNPEGPNGNPDPLASAIDIRETFGRMAMNDIETAALIVGGHTFGKTHGNGDAELVGPEPEAAPIELQGLGWKNPQGTGVGKDAITSGLEVIWTHTPTKWDNSFLEILYGNEWELFKSPAGANQWRPKDGGWANTVPEAFGTAKTHPSMLTTDLAMRERSDLRADHPPLAGSSRGARRGVRQGVVQAAAPRHGSGGALPRPGGPQDDLGVAGRGARPALSCPPTRSATLKGAILDSGLTVPQLVSTAWKAAVVVPRQRQARWRQRWPDPAAAAAGLGGQRARRAGAGDPQARGDPAVAPAPACRSPTWWSSAAWPRSRRPPRTPVSTSRCRSPRVVATPPRSRPTSSRSPTWSPRSDGFRNYLGKGGVLPAEFRLVDRANLLGLSGPELTVLVGGLRVLGANYQDSKLGVFTDKPGGLTNDFFVNLLDMGTEWKPSPADDGTYVGPRTAPAAPRSGPAAVSICCSAPTRNCGRWPRRTPRTTPRRSSSRTSSRRGRR